MSINKITRKNKNINIYRISKIYELKYKQRTVGQLRSIWFHPAMYFKHLSRDILDQITELIYGHEGWSSFNKGNVKVFFW